MNILPKKRWHVRTKDNIARVRRDEAKAAEEEKERERRAKLAEQEARTALLRQRARGTAEETSGLPKIDFIGPGNNEDPATGNNGTQENSDDSTRTKNLDAFSCEINKPCADIFTESGNINFFKDLETGVGSTNSLTNKEHEAEERAEKEKYEKQIGLLTYLGQDSLEATKSKEWYHDSSRCISSLWTVKGSKDSDTVNGDAEHETEDIEVGLKYKTAHDPLNDMIKYAGWKRTKSSSIVGETAATESRQISSVASDSISSPPPLLKKDKKLKKLLKKRHKLDKKILGYSKSKSKKRKRSTSDDSDDSHEMKKRKRVEKDDKFRSQKRKKSEHSKSAKKKKKSSVKSSSGSDGSSSSDSSSQSCYTTDSEAEREQQRQKLAKLREARLAREAVERQREKRLLAGQKPDEVPPPAGGDSVTQKYSSQFNPLLARQNRGLQSGAKYF